jgi:hypothetical protein
MPNAPAAVKVEVAVAPNVARFAEKSDELAEANCWSAVQVFAFERSVEDAALIVMSAEPSNATPFMFRAAASLVAVEALPVSVPVRPPLNAMFVEVALDGNG